MSCRECQFAPNGATIAAQRWREGAGGTPVLALHGWLDNAASFIDLAPLLGERELLALLASIVPGLPAETPQSAHVSLVRDVLAPLHRPIGRLEETTPAKKFWNCVKSCLVHWSNGCLWH